MCFAAMILLALGPGCAATSAEGRAGSRATSLTIAHAAFHDPQVLVAKSMPPQFEIVLTREMPTPGWSFVVDSLTVEKTSGRIVAKLSEIGPTETTAQVITPTQCRLQLGALEPGSYLLELWRRRGASGAHVLTQALVVIAR
jgi:hypothetical protein